MSRPAQRIGAAPASNGASSDVKEQCPVCKASDYLNRGRRFMINPLCYHRMCETCVDRLFGTGPRQCPYAGCKKTLKKPGFRYPTFADVKLEREVDIRRRVAKVFNKREDDFDTLLDYNNYLNDVEDVTFNLINGIEIEASEKKLEAFKKANQKLIAQNETRAEQDRQSFAAKKAFEEKRAKLKAEAVRKAQQEERRLVEEAKREVLDRLAYADVDAATVESEARAAAEKRIAAFKKKQDSFDEDPFGDGISNGDTGFVIRGLKKHVAAEPEKPYDPFGGYDDHKNYFVMSDNYEVKWFEEPKRNDVGGYDINDYYYRALTDAFSGLGVFINEEKEGSDMGNGPGDKDVATAGVAETDNKPKDIKMEDVFS